MSSAPTRTRSLRKPTVGIGRLDRTATTRSVVDSEQQQQQQQAVAGVTKSSRPAVSAVERSGRRASPNNGSIPQPPPSPSRLPVKPPVTRNNPVHARKTSISSNVSTSTTTSRPPVTRSHLSQPSVGTELRSVTGRPRAESKTSTSKPPLTSTTSTAYRHVRNSSTTALPSPGASSSIPGTRPGHSRNRSQGTLLTASTVLSPPNSTTISSSYSSNNSSKQIEPHRPQFSTYQQHYSPAKSHAPKPSTAAILAPPSPSKQPANIAASAATSRLQAELLQLHLLHEAASPTLKAWHESARVRLGEKFAAVQRQHEELIRLEGKQRGQRNALALRAWEHQAASVGTRVWGLEERIQSFSEVLGGVWELGENGSRYARTVRKFERWVREVSDVLDAREQVDGNGGTPRLGSDGKVAFIVGLDDGWKDECHLLARKLQGWKEQLDDLGTLRTSHNDEKSQEDVLEKEIAASSLAIVFDLCREQVCGMLEELETMRRVERKAVEKENAWVRKLNDGVDDEDEFDGEEIAGAIWRRV